ncbi:MAG: hypothetical protein PHU44_17365 [Syntrophales bacterium]|nr:hypothetical protein [Syntrophales bacterium]MDD5643370.1 hypothetical protein [Syntrophales bacterium]
MKRTVASRSFTLMALALMAAVLLLPWGNPGLAAAPAKGCPHCGAVNHGISSGPCCPPEMPNHCGSSGQSGGLCCRGATGPPAFISPQAVVSPTWQGSIYLPVKVILSTPLFPPNIFHPPELSHFPAV